MRRSSLPDMKSKFLSVKSSYIGNLIVDGISVTVEKGRLVEGLLQGKKQGHR